MYSGTPLHPESWVKLALKDGWLLVRNSFTHKIWMEGIRTNCLGRGVVLTQRLINMEIWRVGWLVSWYFEPSQLHRTTLGLKTNFSLSPSCPLHKSLYHKSLLLKPQIKVYPQFRNAHPQKQQQTFWSLFILNGHSTQEHGNKYEGKVSE